MAERMLPQNVSGACSAENSGSVHALFPGISVLGDAVFSGIFVHSGKRTAGSALFIAFADLAYGDLRAYLSGQVCGVFVGLCAGADIYGGQALSIISGLPWQVYPVKSSLNINKNS